MSLAWAGFRNHAASCGASQNHDSSIDKLEEEVKFHGDEEVFGKQLRKH